MSTNWPTWLPIRTDLASLSPYGAPQIGVGVRLNTNENPYSLSASLQSALSVAIANELSELNRYPDRDAVKLRNELANSISRETGFTVDAHWIWAANGSNEIIQTILLAF